MDRTFRRAARFVLRSLTRCYPFIRGSVRLCNSRLHRWLAQGNDLVLVRLRSGPQLLVRTDDWCGRMIYYTADFDRRVTSLCCRLLRRGDVFLDIGANYGEVAMAAAKVVGPSGTVHAFEPQADLARYLRTSAEINGFNNLHVHGVALSDSDGECELVIPNGNSGAASIDGINDPDRCRTARAPMRHSGNYLDGLALPHLRAMKIDVEGHEAPLIEAAAGFLNRHRPVAIVFENHPDGTPFSAKPLIQVLASLGYKFYLIRPKSWLDVQLQAVGDGCQTDQCHDYLALHASAKEVEQLLPIVRS